MLIVDFESEVVVDQIKAETKDPGSPTTPATADIDCKA